MFKDRNINPGDEQCIDDCSNQFCVYKYLITTYLRDLQSLKKMTRYLGLINEKKQRKENQAKNLMTIDGQN